MATKETPTAARVRFRVMAFVIINSWNALQTEHDAPSRHAVVKSRPY